MNINYCIQVVLWLVLYMTKWIPNRERIYWCCLMAWYSLYDSLVYFGLLGSRHCLRGQQCQYQFACQYLHINTAWIYSKLSCHMVKAGLNWQSLLKWSCGILRPCGIWRWGKRKKKEPLMGEGWMASFSTKYRLDQYHFGTAVVWDALPFTSSQTTHQSINVSL